MKRNMQKNDTYVDALLKSNPLQTAVTNPNGYL